MGEIGDTTRDPLLNMAEVLFRHVYPIWLEEDGEPSSQAFHPWRDVDKGQLSTDQSSLTTPHASFVLATGTPPSGFGLNSIGIWGVSVGEANVCQLAAYPDPVHATEAKPENPAHAVIDFTSHPESKWRKIGRKLKVRAIERKKIYPAETNSTNGTKLLSSSNGSGADALPSD